MPGINVVFDFGKSFESAFRCMCSVCAHTNTCLYMWVCAHTQHQTQPTTETEKHKTCFHFEMVFEIHFINRTFTLQSFGDYSIFDWSVSVLTFQIIVSFLLYSITSQQPIQFLEILKCLTITIRFLEWIYIIRWTVSSSKYIVTLTRK